MLELELLELEGVVELALGLVELEGLVELVIRSLCERGEEVPVLVGEVSLPELVGDVSWIPSNVGGGEEALAFGLLDFSLIMGGWGEDSCCDRAL